MGSPAVGPAASMASTETVEEQKHRKRIQNRLYQRARRLRIKDKDGGNAKSAKSGSFQVQRWRLDDDAFAAPSADQSTKTEEVSPDHPEQSVDGPVESYTTKPQINHVGSLPSQSLVKSPPPSSFPFSADHLLQLIQINALRGLYTNKYIVAEQSVYLMPTALPGISLVPYVEEHYPGNAIVLHNGSGGPDSLAPTPLQSTISHSVWINVLPFPRLRDNLIKWEAYFDHAEFITDSVGYNLDLTYFYRPKSVQASRTGCLTPKRSQEREDKFANEQNGLILWGEPYRPESWEFTPGFIRKWGWALEGCESILEISSRWRVKRGEKPLRLSMFR